MNFNVPVLSQGIQRIIFLNNLGALGVLAVKNLMLKIALIRQRYAGDGGAERFVARMLDTLKDRARLTLITREWRPSPGFEALTCNPFYIGRWWRDRSFARDVCRVLRSRRFDLVQSHERIACCDIYRAGDGLHREWLKNRARVLGPLARLGVALNPYHRYLLAAERRLFQSPRLRAVVCNSRMVRDEIKRHFGLPDEKLHVIYSGVDTAAYHPDLKRERAAVRASLGFAPEAPLFLFVGSGFERKGLAAALRGAGATAGGAAAGDRARPARRALPGVGAKTRSRRARAVSGRARRT